MALMSTTAALLCCILWSAIQCQTNICYERADILLVMESSSSVGAENFQLQLQFAATFVNNFQVGVTQFSVIRFGTTPSVVINFGDYNDNTALKNAILNIEYLEGGTDTAAALRLVREQAFTSSGVRKGVPKVVIVSTDGQSNSPNETAVEAARLKSSNVLVLSIGIGEAYVRAELDAIATFPADVFEISDYSQLVSIVQTYSQMVCEEVKQFICNNQDIFFLLDASSNIPPTSFASEISFVSNVSFNFDLLNVRIGAGTFGGGTLQKLITLGQFDNPFNLAQVLYTASQLNGVIDTDSALKSVQSQRLFDPIYGGRPDADKVLVILTDGGSVSAFQARLTATQLRLTGVHIVAVGVSNPNIAELLDLVGNSVLDVVANLGNPNVLASRVLSLTQECSVPWSANKSSQGVSEYCRKNLLENGIHPHPYDCTKFIECTFLRTSIISCDPNLVYNPIIQTCTYPGLAAPCYRNPAIIRTPTPTHVTQPTTSAINKDPVVVPVYSVLCLQYSWADGRHPNPNDCSKFVECGSLVTTLYACNSGDAYDPIKQLCTDRASAHPCNDPLYFGDTVTTVSVGVATNKGPTITNINNLCKDFALSDGNYPDPSHCERFVECTAQFTLIETCPYGLQFNTANSVCDDVHAVDCQINYHYFDRR